MYLVTLMLLLLSRRRVATMATATASLLGAIDAGRSLD